MTRGGILASGTAAILFVVGALVSAGGSDADAQAKKEAPLETKGDASVRPWKRYAGWPARDGSKFNTLGQVSSPPAASAPRKLAGPITGDAANAPSWWPIATGEAHALLVMSWAGPAEPISRVMSVPIFRKLAVQAVRMNTSSTTFTTREFTIRRR